MAGAQSRVELIVDASKAVNPLRKTEQATRKLEGAVKNANGKLRDAKSRLAGVGSSAKRAKGSVESLSGAFTKLAAAVSVIGVGKFVFFKTAELQSQTRSLKVLTGSLETAKGIIAELQAFGNVTPFTSAELIETAKRLKAFGFETEKIVDVTKRLSDIAGATGADLGGIATAFGQIQAKGRLQGEELLQLQERGVDLQGTLREAYGLTAEEFQKALAAGRIGADAVNFALEKLTETGGKYAEGAFAQSDTLSGKLSTLQDNVDNLARVFGETMAPALSMIIDDITKMVNTFVRGLQFMQNSYNDFMKSLRSTTIKDLQKDIEGLNQRIANQQKQLSLVSETGPGGVAAAQGFRDTISQLRALRQSMEADVARLQGTDLFMPTGTFTAPGAPDGAAPPALGAGTGAKGKAAKFAMPGFAGTGIDPALAAEQAFAKQVEQIAQGNMLLQARLEDGEREEQQRQSIASIIEQSGFVDKDRIESARQTLETIFNQTSALEDQLTASEKLEAQQKKASEKMKSLYMDIGASIQQGVVGAIQSAIDGTKSLGEVAKGILDDITSKLLNFLVNAALFGVGGDGGLLGGLFNFGGKKAKGGPVSSGSSYLVGEKGPELFTPGRSGTITPNNAMGGVEVGSINISVQNTGDQLSPAAQKQIAKQVQNVVMSTLVNERRSGGVLG